MSQMKITVNGKEVIIAENSDFETIDYNAREFQIFKTYYKSKKKSDRAYTDFGRISYEMCQTIVSDDGYGNVVYLLDNTRWSRVNVGENESARPIYSEGMSKSLSAWWEYNYRFQQEDDLEPFPYKYDESSQYVSSGSSQYGAGGTTGKGGIAAPVLCTDKDGKWYYTEELYLLPGAYVVSEKHPNNMHYQIYVWYKDGQAYVHPSDYINSLHNELKPEQTTDAADDAMTGELPVNENGTMDLNDAAYDAQNNRETYLDVWTRLISEREAELWNIYTLTKESQLTKFKEQLNSVRKKFNEGRALYTMYLQFYVFGNLVVDTTSPEWGTNCLVSFTHEMNGSGQANQFTLEILFKPNERNVYSIQNLESKLLFACSINDGDNLKDLSSLYRNCSYIYGYGDEPDIRSSKYVGMITDYDCKLDNGNLHYTIKGTAGVVAMKEFRISPKEEYTIDEQGNEVTDPMNFIKRIFEVEFKNPASENYLAYDVQFLSGCYDTVNKAPIAHYSGGDFTQFEQKNLFQVIGDILNCCLTEDQYNNLNAKNTVLPNQKISYSYYVDSIPKSTAYCGTVYIYQLPSVQGNENKDENGAPRTLNSDIQMPFNWFAPSSNNEEYNHMVLSWEPKYDGMLLMAMAANLKLHSSTYKTMDDDGNVVSVKSMGGARTGVAVNGDVSTNTIQEYSSWAFKTQYPYNASLSILGVPTEVPMSTIINVIAKMGNEDVKHHSSGQYMILSKTDKMNSSGFVSTFELTKVCNTFNPEYITYDPNEDEEDVPIETGEGMYNTFTVDPNMSPDAIRRRLNAVAYAINQLELDESLSDADKVNRLNALLAEQEALNTLYMSKV